MSLAHLTSPWPWWLWLLTALWTGSVLLWRSAGPHARFWAAMAVINTGFLIVAGSRVPAVLQTPEDATPWPFWAGCLLLLGGAAAWCGATTASWRHGALWVAALGGAGLAWGLSAPEVGVACLIAAALLTWPMQSLLESSPDDERAPQSAITIGSRSHQTSVFPASLIVPAFLRMRLRGAVAPVPRRDWWLIGVAGLVTVVSTVGLLRHALIIEAHRAGPSRWNTVLPTRKQAAQFRQPYTEDAGAPSVTKVSPEWWALAGIVVALTALPSPRRKAEELIETGDMAQAFTEVT